MIKKILKYIMTIMILGCIVGLVSYKCVNLYIERTYGCVKADALRLANMFQECLPACPILISEGILMNL